MSTPNFLNKKERSKELALNAKIDEKVFNEFRLTAYHKGKFTRGYLKIALIEALKLYINANRNVIKQ